MTNSRARAGTARGVPGRRAILDDIEQTRETLGQTVEALTAKADVPAQLRRRATGAADTARQRCQAGLAVARQHPEVILGTISVVTFTMAAWLMSAERRGLGGWHG
ncbi:MAG TPA: DUF3618 domain-containing protein [Streptosporangiaceae bacterium]